MPSPPHWHTLAANWNRLGPPLRPCTEDVAFFRSALGDMPGHCLLLGVTPELSSLSTNITALDNSPDMIRALWPSIHGAILGDWLDMPFESESYDNILGDGCPVLLEHPLAHQRFFAEAARVLRPGGRFILRVFAGPESPESPEQVCAFALAGSIKGFHAFKWRLSMALAARTPGYTFNVADTLHTFDRLVSDRAKLARETGWSMHDIETIDFYSGSRARYSYPPLSQLRKTIPCKLSEIGLRYGRYELAERCPILVLEKRQ